MFFLPRKYWSYRTVLILMGIEFPFILVILILTGIGSNDLYRTNLWQDGANNGFNSAPNQIVYALTNGRSYSVPLVWSDFITNYTLVLGALSIFILLCKAPMHILNVFFPPISAFIHGSLTVLYIASCRVQAGSDTSDPRHPQSGPAWFITKNCSVAFDPSNIGYCQQAKALFAISIIATVIYFVQTVLAIISFFTTKAERKERRQRREEKRVEKVAEEEALREYEEALKSPAYGIPMTPATMTVGATPVSPQSFTFGRSGGRLSDLPLRNNFSAPNLDTHNSILETTLETEELHQPQPVPYFPPPPKTALK